MRWIVALLAFFIAIAGATAQAGQFGPPEPAAKDGEVLFGVGYFHYSDKGTVQGAGGSMGSKITANQVYAQASHGFMKNAESYLRLGAMDLKVSDAFATGPGLSGFESGFNNGLKPFVTVGAKGIFNITPTLGVGPFLQASLYSNYKDSTAGRVLGFPATQELKVKNLREIDAGVALQGKIGRVIVYGGPFAYWTRADVDWTGTITGIGADSDSGTYKGKNNFGGFAGVKVPVGGKLALEFEGQQKSNLSVGASLTYSF